jgi:tRNA threonylcarbamoyladenosine modification (KEOPS) complex  Pcc1 subunit
MKAEIEIECKEPQIVIKSLKPDEEELKKFDVELKAEKNKVKIEIEAKDIPGLLAGINSYLRLVKVAIDAMEA